MIRFYSYITKEVGGGRFDDDTQADTCLIGQGFWVIDTHTYECNISRLLYSLGLLKLHIVDTVTMENTGEAE